MPTFEELRGELSLTKTRFANTMMAHSNAMRAWNVAHDTHMSCKAALHSMEQAYTQHPQSAYKLEALELEAQLVKLSVATQDAAANLYTAREEHFKARNSLARVKQRLDDAERAHAEEHNKAFKTNRPGEQAPPTSYCAPSGASQRYLSNVREWRAEADVVLGDLANMSIFPTPPTSRCTNISCRNEIGRALAVCDCAVRAAFQQVTGLEPKIEHVRWHPDRFSRCPAEYREQFQAMAKEIFQVTSEMRDAAN